MKSPFMKKYVLFHSAVYTAKAQKTTGSKIDEEGVHSASSLHVCSPLHVFLSEEKPNTIEQVE